MPLVSAVIVTYSNERQQVCAETVRRAIRAGADEVTVVANGMDTQGLQELDVSITRSIPSFGVIKLDTNVGPARALAIAVEQLNARSSTEDLRLLWILDDDNWAEANTLSEQLSVWRTSRSPETTAVSALRADRPAHSGILSGATVEEAYPHPKSFLLQDVATRVTRTFKLNRGVPERRIGLIPQSISIPYAPFGGLLIPVELFIKLGGPRLDYYLYEDDSEFTHRLNTSGGQLLLATRARLKDGLASWGSVESRFIPPQLRHGSDLQIYYATRNRVHFEIYILRAFSWRYVANVICYFSLLTLFGLFTRARRARLRLVLRAIRDGMLARLGPNRRYPLPQVTGDPK